MRPVPTTDVIEGSSREFRTPSPDPNNTNYNLSAATSKKKKTKKPKSTTGSTKTNVNRELVVNPPPATSSISSSPPPPPRKSKRKVNEPKRYKQPPAIREIAKLQSSVKLVIPRAPFGRLLREILHQYGDFRVTCGFLDAIHEASEMYMVQLFEDAHRCCCHRNRQTLSVVDIQLVRFIRGLSDPSVA